jgi:hypothetical protein
MKVASGFGSMVMKVRRLTSATALAIFALVATTAFADDIKCGICGKTIESKYFQVENRARDEKVNVCIDCANIETRCFACGLPVKNPKKLTDGRFLCPTDAKEAILDDAEAKAICLETREQLDREFSRFLAFPSTNIVLTIVDRFTLESLFKTPGYGQRCTSIFGSTGTHEIGGERRAHSISILSSLSKPRFQAVAAHEFTHAWVNENVRPERKATIGQDAVEAFCELIAYEIMTSEKNEFEKKVILANPYTRGQIDAFLAAEKLHGFNAILDWVKAGESAKLDPQDPDNVRQVNDKVVASKPASPAVRPVKYTPALALPEKLTLRAISGSPNRRFAIINDRTFGPSDQAVIHLAKTNLNVRCLEIRTNSVLVQIQNTGEKQELLLPEASRR